jgi:hypothetical protein
VAGVMVAVVVVVVLAVVVVVHMFAGSNVFLSKMSQHSIPS